jgi:cytochrome o ubiquinol oxidase operon protein cyoD
MEDNNTPAETGAGAARGSTASYTVGFVLSLLLSLTAYFAVTHHQNSRRFLLITIFALALTQLLVQLLYFLHLDRESKPRWNLMVAGFAATVVLILVLGSLWIMNNLNYHMAPPAQTDQAIIHDEGVKP